MTLIAIMSDVHGNLEALKQVLDDLQSHEVEAAYCLGDMIGYGPQPQECVDLLRERGVNCTMGNHEQGLINIHYLRQFNQPAADALRKTREMITEETYQWLVSRPKAIKAHGCRMVHGLPPDSVSEYLWKYKDDMAGVFARYSEEICFVGHTHALVRFTCRGGVCEKRPLPQGDTGLAPGMRHLVNIGSVGQPRDGDNRAKYGLFDPKTRILTMRFIPYDIRKTADLITEHGFNRGFADRLW
ncbi:MULTISPECIES: metallophosphoesterase family protein [unclassified Pseudodesulfovibrio]|uniref:metallophosphoesterase family protein n=1 Tax=unclassified Pseudodesulfovibrio TaxID=2661612 RepID=UPI000FEB7AE2|nr:MULTISPECIES: metallophosphoesterase family protein [unclassified Pseudodesulfovibrio]MCJ2165407.1 metallophosphatase family protein [Pseudodesulfovibrio sp. S3-i]RWU03161.1 metallophosphoesterase [Pseudodesulfovibrio sp. S3]